MKTTEAETTTFGEDIRACKEVGVSTMQHVKNVPIRGTASEVGGVMSATMERKKQTESRIVISAMAIN